jgi:excisionase family DNA binding protein
MSMLRTRLELEPDQAPAWGNLRTIQAETAELVVATARSQAAPMAAVIELLTVRQAASRLGVHENTVRNWADKGVLPAARLPGSHFRRFRSADVDRIRLGIMGALAGGSTGPTQELPEGANPSFNNGDDL